MRWVLLLALLMEGNAFAAPTAASASAAPADFRPEVMESIRFFVGTDGKAAASLGKHLDQTVAAIGKQLAADPGGVDAAAVSAFLIGEVAANLRDKRALKGPNGESFPMSTRDLEQTVIDYEAYKLASYVGSGVFPKRYFGYLDEKWDTAPYEKRLKKTVHAAVGLANDFEKRKGSPLRFTDAEIAATFLAEGGAILLREDQANLENVHPVFGVGLDDVTSGVTELPDLVIALDANLSTSLGKVVRPGEEPLSRFARNFTFDEAIAGTTLMWVYEKERAVRKLSAAQKKDLSILSPDEQFIVGSLMYNSGRVFDWDRIDKIRTFTSGAYLADISRKSEASRGGLPVLPPKVALAALIADGNYPVQETSWNAVYHVLQRWGAYHGLLTLTSRFDDHGMFRQ